MSTFLASTTGGGASVVFAVFFVNRSIFAVASEANCPVGYFDRYSRNSRGSEESFTEFQ